MKHYTSSTKDNDLTMKNPKTKHKIPEISVMIHVVNNVAIEIFILTRSTRVVSDYLLRYNYNYEVG